MAIIEVVKYEGPPDVFAWRYPNQELGTWTQLIVHETQEAILYKGQALDSFPAGRHTLSTANIPILSNVINLPFGGKSPFTAEVWFVNKLRSLDVKWGPARRSSCRIRNTTSSYRSEPLANSEFKSAIRESFWEPWSVPCQPLIRERWSNITAAC